MDVILEIFDTFLFDRFYATVAPTSSSSSTTSYTQNAIKNATTFTFASVPEVPTVIARTNQLFQLEPSKYAYMSQLGRDNIYRQGVSLYLITWYFQPPIKIHCVY